jgi:hypothetical protein
MAIRTYDELAEPHLPIWVGDNPELREAERPWWAGMDATKTRHDVICPGMQHRVGLIPSPDGHLVYRLHLIPTYGGALWCPRSLRQVCDVPVPSRSDVMCPHQRDGEPRSA